MRRTVDWDGAAVVIIDQVALPNEHRVLRLHDVDELIDAIRRLAIRGAPGLGVAGGLGVALSALRHSTEQGLDEEAVRADARRLAAARPTAVNLAWGVHRVLARLPDGPDAAVAEAVSMIAEDEQVNRDLSRRAAELVRAACARRPLRLLTHCNSGHLATVSGGTALGAVFVLAAAGEVGEVLASETRPLLQGSRLTAWELREAGIPHRLCVDSAAAAAIAAGMIDAVLVGADRVCANGDVANKIGTYPLALAAARAGVPFVVVAPESSVDETLASGAEIEIEQRPAAEVTELAGRRLAPEGTAVYNPAFDVTPADLVTAVVTERRVIRH